MTEIRRPGATRLAFLSLLGLPPVTLAENATLAAIATLVEAVSPPDVDNFLMPLATYLAYPRVVG